MDDIIELNNMTKEQLNIILAKQDNQEDGPRASILSGTVSTGSIDTELIGGGTLAAEDAVTVSVPAAVKLTEFLVSNGDAVTAGTPIAAVDRVTVMTAISRVQETLEYLSGEIEGASAVSTTEKVTALAGGTVKILYAEEGESVQTVMLEHGALAVLSLDGLMAVDLEAESTLAVGSAVTVTLSDGTETAGKLVKNLSGELTVTVEDDGYAVGEAVQISTGDGTAIGELYIYSPWNATAYAGTVADIQVGVGDQLGAGKTLMVLEDVGHSAAYRQLIAQRQEYEALMLELFQMYQTQTVTAPCGGVVSGILVLAMAGLILAAVLGYIPERKWLLWAGMAVLGVRVLFVDLFGYLLPLSELKIIAYIPMASNLFGVAAISCLCPALKLQKAE